MTWWGQESHTHNRRLIIVLIGGHLTMPLIMMLLILLWKPTIGCFCEGRNQSHCILNRYQIPRPSQTTSSSYCLVPSWPDESKKFIPTTVGKLWCWMVLSEIMPLMMILETPEFYHCILNRWIDTKSHPPVSDTTSSSLLSDHILTRWDLNYTNETDTCIVISKQYTLLFLLLQELQEITEEDKVRSWTDFLASSDQDLSWLISGHL